MIEGSANPERKISKEEVLESVRSLGIENPEAMKLVQEWTIQRESEVQTSKDAIVFNLERTDLYVAAGDIAGAIENLADALYQAKQENESELIDVITNKINELSQSA